MEHIPLKNLHRISLTTNPVMTALAIKYFVFIIFN